MGRLLREAISCLQVLRPEGWLPGSFRLDVRMPGRSPREEFMTTFIRKRLAQFCLCPALVLLSGFAQWGDLSEGFAGTGEIRGRVELADAATRSPSFENANDPEGRSAIVVFLEPEIPPASGASRPPFWKVPRIEIGRAGSSPGLEWVPTGRPFRFENADSVHHELFTARSDGSLRIPLPPGDESEIVRLSRPGVVRFFCALHPEEFHLMVVSARRGHAFVDGERRFRLRRIEPGRYRIRAVSGSDWSAPLEVTVGAAEIVELTLRLGSDPGD